MPRSPILPLLLAASSLVPTAHPRGAETPRPVTEVPRTVTAERSADEAIYDARHGTPPRGTGPLEGSGATGGGGQQG